MLNSTQSTYGKNWRTTLGSALSTAGSFIFGANVLVSIFSDHLSPEERLLILRVCIFGLLLGGFGKMMNGVFGQDVATAESLNKDLQAQILRLRANENSKPASDSTHA